jgi:hypothetical protein
VAHQLRFRNIGGLIIIDLIDMEPAENREKVYRALQEALRQDKAKTNILKISELGLVEMTRKRTRENLVQQLCEPCSHCEGRGYVLSRDSVAHKVLREIKKDLPHFCGRRIAIAISPRVAEVLLGAEREALAELEAEMGREVEVRAVPGMHQEQFEVISLDAGEPVEIALAWLGTGEPPQEPELIAGVVERPPEPAAPPAQAEDVEIVDERRRGVAPIAPFAALALEAFSPLDLGSDSDGDETDEAVDEAPDFPIMPRPEQGEES